MESVEERPDDWDGHLLLVHHTERQRRDAVAAWVRCGLEVGAKVLYTEPPGEPGDRTLTAMVKEYGVDADSAVAAGHLQVVVADGQTYDPEWQVGVVDKALAEGYPSVWWAGEATTAWTVMSPVEHAGIERATDEMCRTRPVSVLCSYSARLTLDTLQSVSAMHGAGVRESLLRTSNGSGRLVLAGEVDASNERVLCSVLLAAVSSAGQEPLVVDLSGLGFVDVRGARTLLAGTTAFRGGGGRLHLVGARPSVGQVLRLLGVDRAMGIVMEPA